MGCVAVAQRNDERSVFDRISLAEDRALLMVTEGFKLLENECSIGRLM